MGEIYYESDNYMLIENLIFLTFAITLVASSLMVVFGQHPVRSALFLVLAFFSAAGLWLILEAEFLALVLILVYVGAVMTLFLFVIMTLSLDFEKMKFSFFRYYVPLGLVLVAGLVLLMFYITTHAHLDLIKFIPHQNYPADYSNTKAIGSVLYTNYAFALEIAGVLLLAAIVAAISLCVRDVVDSKSQKIDAQIATQPKDRIRIVKDLGR